MSESTYEHKPGNGSLFRNKDSNPDNNQPYYKGDIKLQDGTMQEISAWVNESKAGKKYLSLKLQNVYVAPVEVKKEEPKSEEVSPDLPF